VPIVSSTASPAVAVRPGAPRPAAIRSASGTSDGAAVPSTPTVATANPRYSTTTIASAAKIARGSWRAGSFRSPARCDTASQPMKDSISRLAAVPIADQPWGANGAQFSARLSGIAVTTATSRSAASSPVSASWSRAVVRSPTAFAAITAAIIAAAPATAVPRPAPSSSAT